MTWAGLAIALACALSFYLLARFGHRVPRGGQVFWGHANIWLGLAGVTMMIFGTVP
jgi:hypothetical protein